MNKIIPWKSSDWKQLPDPKCKSILGRDGAGGISCTWLSRWGGEPGGLGTVRGFWHGQGPLCVPSLGGYYKEGQVVLVKIGGRGCTWLVGAHGSSEHLAEGAPLCPQVNVNVHGGCRGKQGPLAAPPGKCGPFPRKGKEPLSLWRGCHWRCATSTQKAGALLPLPCQGSSNQPSRERAAANTPLFAMYS